MLCLKKFGGYIFLYMVTQSFAFQLIYYICKSIFQVCELFKHWRDKSHPTRWLQAFAELVRFVVLSLKSHWKGRWTTSDAVYMWTIFVSIFIRRFIYFLESDLDRFYVKCIFNDMGHVFPWKQPWEFVCELYFFIFSWDELCISLKDKDDIISLKIIMRTFEL